MAMQRKNLDKVQSITHWILGAENFCVS